VSYVPDSPLSPAMFLAMQSDKIVVRFEHGRVASATPSLTFERAYRISEVNGDSFTITLWILEMPTAGGNWERTPYRDLMHTQVKRLVGELCWTLEPR